MKNQIVWPRLHREDGAIRKGEKEAEGTNLSLLLTSNNQLRLLVKAYMNVCSLPTYYN